MIRIAIVDDENEECLSLMQMIEQYLRVHQTTAEIQTFCDAAQFIKGYAGGFDIIFMDIQMPEMDGMQAATLLREIDHEVLLIFVTSMIQYAVQGYRVDAMDYIVKPVTSTLLEHSLMRALRKLESRTPKHITIRSLSGLRNVNVNEIIFAEAVNHRVTLHLREDQFECMLTLNQLEHQLTGCGFFRCHAAFLVNMKKVERIEGNDIYMAGQLVPISKHRRKDFMKELTASWGG